MPQQSGLIIDTVFSDGGMIGRLDEMIVYIDERLKGILAEVSESFISIMSTYPPEAVLRLNKEGQFRNTDLYAKRSTALSYSKRTGELAASWKYAINDLGEGHQESFIENTAPHAPYVHGSATQRQRAYHARRGWANTSETLRQVAGGANAAVASAGDRGTTLEAELERLGKDLQDFITGTVQI